MKASTIFVAAVSAAVLAGGVALYAPREQEPAGVYLNVTGIAGTDTLYFLEQFRTPDACDQTRDGISQRRRDLTFTCDATRGALEVPR